MRNLSLQYTIVCRCGVVIDESTVGLAELDYERHITGIDPCKIKTEIWRGWSVREVP